MKRGQLYAPLPQSGLPDACLALDEDRCRRIGRNHGKPLHLGQPGVSFEQGLS
jgi:hypothetical protein